MQTEYDVHVCLIQPLAAERVDDAGRLENS